MEAAEYSRYLRFRALSINGTLPHQIHFYHTAGGRNSDSGAQGQLPDRPQSAWCEVIVLVDYDNLLLSDRSRTLVSLIDKILFGLSRVQPLGVSTRVRLYGGWFDRHILSRKAQQLLPTIRREFPRPVTVQGAPTGALVQVELAMALEASPGKYLTHTYRARRLPDNINCASLPFDGCAQLGACEIESIPALIRDKQCPARGCSVALENVLNRPEQKLVDCMMTADVVHLSQHSTDAIVMISDDDDLWPGIHLALLNGAQIVHVHPHPDWTAPPHYIALVEGAYQQLSL